MHHSEGLSDATQLGLGFYYLIVAILNLGFACYWAFGRRDRKQTALWTTVTGVFLVHAFIYLTQNGWIMPQGIRDALDFVMNPVSYFILAVAGFIVFLVYRRTL